MLINCGLQISDCGFKDQKFMQYFKQSAFRNPKSKIIPISFLAMALTFKKLSV